MHTVLLIEDNEPVAHRIADGLRDAGHFVHVSPDAMAALHVLRFMRPDLILLDLELPHMSGLKLLQNIRARPEGADLRVVVITATDITATAPEAVQLGVISVISKHRYSLEQMVRHVNEMLEERPA